MTDPIRVFGEQARNIRDVQLFVAHVRSVEGRTVVELRAKEL
jgi:hypothetical protein